MHGLLRQGKPGEPTGVLRLAPVRPAEPEVILGIGRRELHGAPRARNGAVVVTEFEVAACQPVMKSGILCVLGERGPEGGRSLLILAVLKLPGGLGNRTVRGEDGCCEEER